ncbi:nucleotide-diphospho-sugar transferase [Zopfochytrium polystomum]|nr:nucleotide-diphospho-sugar transferase [Zopfochytrium polystomum]
MASSSSSSSTPHQGTTRSSSPTPFPRIPPSRGLRSFLYMLPAVFRSRRFFFLILTLSSFVATGYLLIVARSPSVPVPQYSRYRVIDNNNHYLLEANKTHVSWLWTPISALSLWISRHHIPPAIRQSLWNCDRGLKVDGPERVCSPERMRAAAARGEPTTCTPKESRWWVSGDAARWVPLGSRNWGGNECSGNQSIYNHYQMEHLDFSDLRLADTCSLPRTSINPTAYRIPKIVHFVFGLKYDFGGLPFLFFHYMSIKMAHDSIKPDRILLHYKYQPTGFWWEKAKKLVELVEVDEVPTSIFGNEIVDVAHQADVVRLRALLKYGGIYLDSDVFVYRSLDPLLHHSTVLAKEDEYGLCNAIIMSAPHSPFVAAWYDGYRTFDKNKWNEHSVLLPRRLAKERPKDLCVLPRVSWFYPLFVHDADEYIFDNAYQYAYHAWNHKILDRIHTITPDYVRNINSSFTRLLRQFLDKDVVGNFSGAQTL